MQTAFIPTYIETAIGIGVQKDDVIEAIKTPRIGDDVLYVLPDGRSRGQTRPAKVVRVWSATTLNLQVLTDGINDYPMDTPGGNGLLWASSVTYAVASLGMPNTWHWSE